jgi:23S rRNA (adenine2030-N6)-methyltransferase
LWYPILPAQAHIQMIEALIMQDYPQSVCHETMFETDLENHRLKGSGLFIINAPYGVEL